MNDFNFSFRFQVSLNRDTSKFASPMWTAVVGGASVAMVTLLLRHGGSWFVSRSNSVDKSIGYSECTYPALALAVKENHWNLTDHLNLIEQDNLVFPVDRDTVKVFVSFLPRLLSKGRHHGFVRWLLRSQKLYLDYVLQHRPRMINLLL